MILVINSRGEQYFVSRSFVGEPPNKLAYEDSPHLLWILIFFVLQVLPFFSLVLILMMRSVASPVERLRDWAKSLSAENLKYSPPDFRYNELNTLAAIVKNSLGSVQKSLEREQVFFAPCKP